MFGKDAIVISLKLFIITAIAALCLAFVNKVTTPIIQVNTLKAEEEALQKVLQDAYDFKVVDAPKSTVEGVTVEKVNVGFAGDAAVGYVVTAVSSEGYGGDVKVMVGIDKDLKVTRIEILEHSETAGLGANAKKPKFAGQYEGKTGEFAVVKGAAANENEISAISSATVTSKAVTKAVNAALAAAADCEAKDVSATAEKTAEKEDKIKKETEKQLEAAEGGKTE